MKLEESVPKGEQGTGGTVADPTPARRTRSVWRSLKEDDSFRATVLVVFVIPAVLMAGTIGWILRAIAMN